MPNLHPVIQSYLSQFVQESGLDGVAEDTQFEAFATTCVVSSHYPDQFDSQELLTDGDDESIDGVAVIIGDELVLTADDAKTVFAQARRSANLEVTYIFVQAKRTPHFDGGDILKFITGVSSLFQPSSRIRNEYLREFKASRRNHALDDGTLWRCGVEGWMDIGKMWTARVQNNRERAR